MLLFTLSDPHCFLKSSKKVKQKIQNICQVICHYLKIKKRFIFDVNITNNLEIKNINCKYRGMNKITDVISFAFCDNKEISTFLLGEIFICYPFCAKKAKKSNFSINYEFYLLIIHGILHLFGFDHKTVEQQNKMWKITQMILDNCHIK